MKRSDVLLYFIQRYHSHYGKLYGRKKLQKLLFLVEHLDPNTGRIVPSRGITGYRFKIWLYGPFSEEVYQDLEELVDKGLVVEKVMGSDAYVRVNELDVPLPLYEDDGYPKVIYIYYPRRLFFSSGKVRLPPQLKEKIDLIIKEYGGLTPTQLEKKVLKMLNLTPQKKLKYMGTSIDEYLRKERMI